MAAAAVAATRHPQRQHEAANQSRAAADCRPGAGAQQDPHEHAEDADAGHLPAFLLRPVPAKV